MKKVIALGFAAPFLALAQGTPSLGNFETLMRSVGRLIDLALPMVVAIALLTFFWGLVRYIFAASDDKKRKEGRDIMIWGIVALFVMVSVWGLVAFLGNAVGIQQGNSSGAIPTVTGLPR